VEVVEPAVPADVDDPVSPRVLLNTLLSILVGLGAGMAMAFFVEYLDTSVKTIGDIERLLGASVLAVIPQRVKPLNVEGSGLAQSEPYRLLRTNIQFSKKAGEGKTFCFTSGGVGEGKSLTLFNLAIVCAQLGEKVAVVDSDLHRPRQHRFFGVENEKGLANVLAGEMPIQSVLRPTGIPNLSFVPSGRMATGVQGLMDSAHLAEIARALKASFDRVLFDAPPVLGVSDALLLARNVDAVLLVVQHRKYPKAISLRAKEVLENAGVNVTGVILNKINMSRDYSHYYYYYASYYAEQDRRQRA
jgi:capsular exopolysaccharide synthesis family protein